MIPFHRAVVADEAFAPADPTQPFSVHTRWIETEWHNTVEPYSGSVAKAQDNDGERQTIVVEVDGKRIEVALPGGLPLGGGNAKKKAPKRSSGSKRSAAVSGDALTAPMQGTIVKIAVEEGQTVEAGELVAILEAMKMEQPINAHKSGTITGITAAVGDTVPHSAVIVEIRDLAM